MDLKIHFEDAHLLVVEKPPGLLSVPGRGPEKTDCVVARAARRYGWVREVHRLDQATSGLMILARNPDSHRRLSAAFAERRVEKTYIALVPSRLSDPEVPAVEFRIDSPDSGRIRLFQRLDPDNRPRQITDAVRGREAVTYWRIRPETPSGVLFSGTARSDAAGVESSDAAEEPGAGDLPIRLELQPRTGRTHQLRLAMAVCGAPILGDNLYGSAESGRRLPRMMLHAAGIVFSHPIGGECLRIESAPEF